MMIDTSGEGLHKRGYRIKGQGSAFLALCRGSSFQHIREGFRDLVALRGEFRKQKGVGTLASSLYDAVKKEKLLKRRVSSLSAVVDLAKMKTEFLHGKLKSSRKC